MLQQGVLKKIDNSHLGMFGLTLEEPSFTVQQPGASNLLGQPKPKIMRPKILLVEDTPICLRVVRSLLEDLGFHIEAATSGEEALKLFDESFSAVLLDLGLPDIDGYTVCEKIRTTEQQNHHVPIIACTAYELSDVRDRCMQVGMNDVMNKPKNIKELSEKLAQFVNF